MNQRPFVGVIGAGPSGLAACKTLAQWGIPFAGYEAGSAVGGHWVLDNTSGTSAAYRSLRTNTHKGMSRYSDFALPDDFPDYPSHEQMADWFGRYARHFALVDRIRLETRVEHARPTAGGGFELTLRSGERVRHDALVVAIGNLWDPRWPQLEGAFDGPVIHAKDYRAPSEPVDCAGRKVLVIGLGTTACELAVELSHSGAADPVVLSARSGQTILPRVPVAVPHPSDPLTGPLRWLPPPLRRPFFEAVFPRVLRQVMASLPRPEDVGLPPAPTSPFEKRVVLNDEILERCGSGAIRAKPGVRRLLGSKVEFEDGSVEEIDVIIAATGYRLSFPFLRESLPELERDGLRLAWGVRHPRLENLFVVGVMQAICSIWPRSEQQMRFIAPFLAGEAAWPGPRATRRATYSVLGVPFGNCQIHTAELQRTLRWARRRAWGRALRRASDA
jgi:cation diffusion facilitator CzcD-associated flavoprotein CzcO